MSYTARITSPWENEYLGRKETYSECVHGILTLVSGASLDTLKSLQIHIVKGNPDYPEYCIEEKFDLSSWIEYKNKQ